MADGSIEFSTTLDNSDLEAKLKDAEKKVDDLKRKIESKTAERNGIAEQMKQANEEINRARESIEKLKQRREELKASGGTSGQLEAVSNEIGKELTSWEQQNAALDKLQSKLFAVDDEVEGYTNSLKSAEAEYDKLGNEAQKQAKKSNGAFARASTGIKTAMANAATNARSSFSSLGKSISSPFDTLERKIIGSLKKVFVFSMIVKGVKALKAEIGSMAQQNEQFTAGIMNLKAVMSGILSQIVAAVLPAVISVVNFIASAFESIAGFIDAIFGSNLSGAIAAARSNAGSGGADAANDMADAQDRQAKSAKNLAKEQKKANAQVMGFDELNQLSAESSNNAADNGYGASGGAGGGGLAGFVPDLGMFDGLFKWLDELKNRILNDVEGPFARIREGLQLIKKGWDEIVQGIQTGNWALVWKGIGDIVIGALYVIEGAFGALMDWLNEMTGGKFSETFEGLKNIVHGAVEFIEGLLRGDLPLAFQGLVDIITGIAQVANGTVNAAFGLLRGGVEAIFAFLGEKFPELKPMFDGVKDAFVTVLNAIEAIFHGVIDGVKTFLQGALDFIVGLFTLDGDRILSGVKTMGDGIGKVFEGIWNAIVTIMTPINNWLSQNVFGPMERAFNNAFDSAVKAARGAWDGIRNAFSNVANFFGQIFGNAWENVKKAFSRGGQVFNGLVGAVTKAFKSLGNNVIDGLNWAISQPFNGINSIINALNGWKILDIYPFNFPTVSVPRIPHLASGAVIPPNREFMAVLGDQSNGRNLEAPESLIRQIVKDETSAAIASLASLLTGGGGDVSLILNVDGEQLAIATERGRASAARRGAIKTGITFS